MCLRSIEECICVCVCEEVELKDSIEREASVSDGVFLDDALAGTQKRVCVNEKKGLKPRKLYSLEAQMGEDRRIKDLL